MHQLCKIQLAYTFNEIFAAVQCLYKIESRTTHNYIFICIILYTVSSLSSFLYSHQHVAHIHLYIYDSRDTKSILRVCTYIYIYHVVIRVRHFILQRMIKISSNSSWTKKKKKKNHKVKYIKKNTDIFPLISNFDNRKQGKKKQIIQYCSIISFGWLKN